MNSRNYAFLSTKLFEKFESERFEEDSFNNYGKERVEHYLRASTGFSNFSNARENEESNLFSRWPANSGASNIHKSDERKERERGNSSSKSNGFNNFFAHPLEKDKAQSVIENDNHPIGSHWNDRKEPLGKMFRNTTDSRALHKGKFFSNYEPEMSRTFSNSHNMVNHSQQGNELNHKLSQRRAVYPKRTYQNQVSSRQTNSCYDSSPKRGTQDPNQSGSFNYDTFAERQELVGRQSDSIRIAPKRNSSENNYPNQIFEADYFKEDYEDYASLMNKEYPKYSQKNDDANFKMRSDLDFDVLNTQTKSIRERNRDHSSYNLQRSQVQAYPQLSQNGRQFSENHSQKNQSWETQFSLLSKKIHLKENDNLRCNEDWDKQYSNQQIQPSNENRFDIGRCYPMKIFEPKERQNPVSNAFNGSSQQKYAGLMMDTENFELMRSRLEGNKQTTNTKLNVISFRERPSIQADDSSQATLRGESTQNMLQNNSFESRSNSLREEPERPETPMGRHRNIESSGNSFRSVISQNSNNLVRNHNHHTSAQELEADTNENQGKIYSTLTRFKTPQNESPKIKKLIKKTTPRMSENSPPRILQNQSQSSLPTSLDKRSLKKESSVSDKAQNLETVKPFSQQLQVSTPENLQKSSLQKSLYTYHALDTKRAVTFGDLKENLSSDPKEKEETSKPKPWSLYEFNPRNKTDKVSKQIDSSKMSIENLESQMFKRKNSNSCATTQEATETHTMSSDIKNPEHRTDYDSNSFFTTVFEKSSESNGSEDENSSFKKSSIRKTPQPKRNKPRKYKKRKGSVDQVKEPKKKNSMKYSEVVESISSVLDFDFTNKKLLHSRSNPMNNMTGAVFWFYICNQYFPRAPFVKDSINQLFEEIEKGIEGVNLDCKPRITKRRRSADLDLGESKSLSEKEQKLLSKFKSAIREKVRSFKLTGWASSTCSHRNLDSVVRSTYDAEDDQWLLELRVMVNEFAVKNVATDWVGNLNVMKKAELSDLITVLEGEQIDASRQNTDRLCALKLAAKGTLEDSSVFYTKKQDLEDLLVDIRIKPQEEENYLSYLEHAQRNASKTKKATNEGRSSKKALKSITNDCDCQICNDGDYTEDNKIVFCSKCNISVHQKCYGIITIPKDDWICELCLTFGPLGRFMRCPLCPNRSGALKPTKLTSSTDLFKGINPKFHAFLQSYTSKFGSPCLGTKKEVMTAANTISVKDLSQALYYNYHCDVGKPNELDTPEQEPKPSNIWVHVSCIQFLPELEFENKTTRIQGLEFIDTERPSYECSICHQKEVGVTLSCGKDNCSQSFHPECARREGLEIRIKDVDSENLMSDDLNPKRKKLFVAYCQQHRKSRVLRRLIETREKTQIKEIMQFTNFLLRDHVKSTIEEQAEPLSPRVNLKKLKPTRKAKEKIKKSASSKPKKIKKTTARSSSPKSKTEKETQQKTKNSDEKSLPKTVSARKAEKAATKIREQETIIRKSTPKPFTSKKFCCACLSYKINDEEHSSVVDCADCQKSYHLACIDKTVSSEQLINFKCSDCRECLNEDSNPTKLQTMDAKTFEEASKENTALDWEAVADQSMERKRLARIFQLSKSI